MASELDTIEQRITELVQSDFGLKYGVVLTLRDIPEIPIDTLADLQDKFRRGEAVLRQTPLSVSGPTFDLIGTSAESRLFGIFSILNFLVPPDWVSLLLLRLLVVSAFSVVPCNRLETGEASLP